MYVYSLIAQSDIPVSSADITIYTPGIGTLFYGLISSGRIHRILNMQLMPFTILQFLFHQVPINAGRAGTVWNETFA